MSGEEPQNRSQGWTSNYSDDELVAIAASDARYWPSLRRSQAARELRRRQKEATCG